jgi:hypothetical protein
MAETSSNGPVDRGSIEPHVRTYDRVIGILKWGTIACVLVAALVIWLIAT